MRLESQRGGGRGWGAAKDLLIFRFCRERSIRRVCGENKKCFESERNSVDEFNVITAQKGCYNENNGVFIRPTTQLDRTL